jgi:predicted nuclease with TOPRIM domain
MSKRFGRNQKRKLRDENAALKSKYNKSLSLNGSLLDAQYRLEGKLQEWASRIIRLVGQDSAFALELAETKTKPDRLGKTVRMSRPRNLVDLMIRSDGTEQMTMERIISALSWKFENEDDPDVHRKVFMLRAECGQVAYAVSTEHVADLRSDERVIRDLSDRIANELLTNIK